MSTPIDDGGPAMPGLAGQDGCGQSIRWVNGEVVNIAPGMSLREWYIGLALAGAMSRPNILPTAAALDAIAAADAALAARKEQP